MREMAGNVNKKFQLFCIFLIFFLTKSNPKIVKLRSSNSAYSFTYFEGHRGQSLLLCFLANISFEIHFGSIYNFAKFIQYTRYYHKIFLIFVLCSRFWSKFFTVRLSLVPCKIIIYQHCHIYSQLQVWDLHRDCQQHIIVGLFYYQVPFLRISDATYGFHHPCVADIKIGPLTHSPDASVQKVMKKQAKYPPKDVLGFRIMGFRVSAINRLK